VHILDQSGRAIRARLCVTGGGAHEAAVVVDDGPDQFSAFPISIIRGIGSKNQQQAQAGAKEGMEGGVDLRYVVVVVL